MPYGDTIRQKREASGYSQDDMAELLNMSQNAYWKIENGESKLKAETLEKIAAILKLDAADFLQGDYRNVSIKTKQNYDHASAITVNNNDFQAERKVWQELDKARQETIAAQNATIAAKDATIDALKLALGQPTN